MLPNYLTDTGAFNHIQPSAYPDLIKKISSVTSFTTVRDQNKQNIHVHNKIMLLHHT